MGSRRRYLEFPAGFITKTTVAVVSGGVLGFSALNFFGGSEKFHRDCAMPTVHKLFDPETAHRLAVRAVGMGLMPTGKSRLEYPQLETELWGLKFRNPIGLAAGFDKNADAILGLTRIGFGFVEVGTVTPLPQSGNPKPRIFRLIEDKALINRYGFNSEGHGHMMTRLRGYQVLNENEAGDKQSTVVLGVNVGCNKDTTDSVLDYTVGIGLMGHYCDYLVVNISSPNTPGLRSLQKRQELEKLLIAAVDARNRLQKETKLLVKVAPDLSAEERKDVAKVCLNPKCKVDGLIVANTTVDRPESLKSSLKTEMGGLSGPPVRARSTECIRDFYSLTKGQLTIIGSGGVTSGRDAYEKIRAGASLVQLYTALVYEGFPVVGKIKRELVECLEKDGFKTVVEAVGADFRKDSG